MGKGNKATLKDIARETGYSVNTVSRALREKDDIAEQTREQIKAAAAKMGHISNTLASSLRLGYTNTIAVILGDVSNPHFAIMMKEIEGRAREDGYSSFLLNSNEDEELEFAAIQSALNKSVDGIILCPAQKSDKNIRYLQSVGVPFVLIGRRFETPDTDYVICNDELGGYQATKTLLDLGHTDILMLHGPTYISSARERLLGYRRAYAQAGFPVREELVREVPVTSWDCGNLMGSLIGGKPPFTAIFAFSDLLAWTVWGCLGELGIRVPEDCSLVGFDHIQSRLAIPLPLTTVCSHKSRMSVSAVELLLEKMRGAPTDDCRHIIIDTTVAPGVTTVPPPVSRPL